MEGESGGRKGGERVTGVGKMAQIRGEREDKGKRERRGVRERGREMESKRDGVRDMVIWRVRDVAFSILCNSLHSLSSSLPKR